MKTDGFGRQLDFEDVSAKDLIYSQDQQRAVTWHVSRHREDRFDEDTDFEIIVFDVSTKTAIKRLYRSHRYHHDTHAEEGKYIVAVTFGLNLNEIIIHGHDDSMDGSQELVLIEKS